MDYDIENITAYDNMNGAGILGKVTFLYENHSQSIVVHVDIPLDKEASLAVIEQRIFEQAKKQLKELASEI
ncbi:TPA: hypothetical protein ACPZMC_004420 [Yersinia enterocolitica]|uniref:Uncharacterized protein n=2 Tax=Yersinia TaxID=629 RepID=A0AAD2V407_YEREN|nr:MULTISPECIES: hypothetical protein [Yersinia]EKN3404832.1 hypothetical protein [Yersinia enterocolitica]EKN3563092.1 hypothetical protein [Yersinia enterocolitica]EKN3828409.1 hypothetical protein [Yersinia enterocolitica]EKN3995639.1 hypothetical protein [Yersinia enterocolitica]EKN4765988.1 hypothetical protein [Yersinia enterocolitica]